MKMDGKNMIIMILTLLTVVSPAGCTDSDTANEISVEEKSVVSRKLTAYEKQLLNESVETELDNACKVLYQCVLTGSITQNTTGDAVSFSDKLPAVNASPNERRRMASELTLENAVEYFQLRNSYSKENISKYGFLEENYNDEHIIRGTIVKIDTVKKVTEEYTIFSDMDVPLSSFLDAAQLL